MKLRCVFCGRQTIPALMIGAQAVGPTCAKRAGLLQTKPRKGSGIVIFKRKQVKDDCGTMDLFKQLEDE